jgi:NTP pyrophosphatase (non-canonical NTP hydrolase)
MSKLYKNDAEFLNNLRDSIHDESVQAGWYIKHDAVKQILANENPELADFYEMVRELSYISLIHTEISEAVEGCRKEINDDHLPHRKMVEVELADTIIRILDLCGRRNYDIGGALVEKVAYNKTRKDHKLETRSKLGGKKL